ncbi:hypothetical protein RDMS_12475 [Deinococcus sp. RL]|uniref:hypothetical protein n=1 Tax=Deinococcus sp. RL TaxID=1489678 RepID=UPI0004D63F3C|nr:hypothetical protein [Deinococcus sp. RL]KEF33329.1 hypothetical protein RDMS_12475 [Deinococcus sp. RL]
MPDREFLRQRNALWARLRALPPDSPEVEAAANALADLVGWSREQVLAGLGLTAADLPQPGAAPNPPGEAE